MKKLIALAVLVFGTLSVSFAAKYNLPNNDSRPVFFPVKEGKLTGTGYMNALKSVKLGQVDTGATTATLTTTLAASGTVKNNFIKNTYTITVGYTSCKVADYVNRRDLPKTVTVDLTNVKCLNKAKPVNFLPEIKAGKRMNVFFAKQNGVTRDTVVTVK